MNGFKRAFIEQGIKQGIDQGFKEGIEKGQKELLNFIEQNKEKSINEIIELWENHTKKI